MATTPKIGMTEITENQNDKYVTHNDALRILDAIVQCTAIDKDLSEPPGAPSDGDTYIVGGTSSSSSDWNGEDDNIAYYKNTAWIFITPSEGWRCYVQDEGATYQYDGASAGWNAIESVVAANSFDIGASKAGQPASAEVLIRIPFVRSVSFPDDFAGSQGVVGTDPASSAGVDFTIKKDGVQIGLMSFASGATTATFTTDSAAETFAAGEVLTVEAPNPQDADLSDVGFVLKGTKV